VEGGIQRLCSEYHYWRAGGGKDQIPVGVTSQSSLATEMLLSDEELEAEVKDGVGDVDKLSPELLIV